MSICEELSKRFGEDVKCSQDKEGNIWVDVNLDALRDVLKFLLEQGFDHLTTITGHDTGEKIVLIYHLIKFGNGKAINLNVRTWTDREKSIAPSILDIYPSALVYEREVYDLLGVKFEGHPGLKRILLPEDLPEDFHPLRKDFKLE